MSQSPRDIIDTAAGRTGFDFGFLRELLRNGEGDDDDGGGDGN